MADHKHRVYLALYLQEGLDEDDRHELGLSFYHWAVWIEPKGAKDDTSAHCFDVVPEGPIENWHFRYDDAATATRSTGLLLRVMVGKFPRYINISRDVLSLLYDIPVPNPESDMMEDTVTWTAEALLTLQERGLVENLDVATVMQDAANAADRVRKGFIRVGGDKVNAVGNRKFP